MRWPDVTGTSTSSILTKEEMGVLGSGLLNYDKTSWGAGRRETGKKGGGGGGGGATEKTERVQAVGTRLDFM